MSEWASFGDADRFEVSVRWSADRETRERRPAHGGWSTGELRLKVGGLDLTRPENGGASGDSIKWYLLPFFEWLARNWLSLLHEERFAWQENTSASAATATFLAMRRLIASTSIEDQNLYDEVHAWWSRHSLRAADASALYPDLFLRRLRDDIEVSWTARQPRYSPDGFRLNISPGIAILPVSNVATPLWESLVWAAGTAVVNDDLDRASLAELQALIGGISALTGSDFSASYLSEGLLQRVEAARTQLGLADHSSRLAGVPAVDAFDDAVLMFGGVSPEIDAGDAIKILEILKIKSEGEENFLLAKLIDQDIGLPLAAAYTEGYDLAEQLLENIGADGPRDFMDIAGLLQRLGVVVIKKKLQTNSIRGAAVAVPGHAPCIIVNETSSYNRSNGGQRFTLAHELFHILYDRSRARKVAHTSGPWAAPGVEKRANAFAAMLLMPRDLLRSLLPLRNAEVADVHAAARSLRVGVSALVEHLYNTDLIDELKRDELRSQTRNG